MFFIALDSITIYHLIKELRPQLEGLKIDKISQPEKEEVHFQLRGPGRSRRLLLSAGATSARLHFTEESKKNPLSAPMFCMILRKHLEGARLLEIQQQNLERVITIVLANYNERGDLQQYYLHLEIMGKHSNLILMDPQTGHILDGLRRYGSLVSRHREVLPGRPYIPPPPQNKLDYHLTEETFQTILLSAGLEQVVSPLLTREIHGISPELAAEICLRAELEPGAHVDELGAIDFSRLYQAFSSFLLKKDHVKLAPRVYYESPLQKILPKAFTFLPYRQYETYHAVEQPSLNAAVDFFYRQKAAFSNMEALRGSLRKVVRDQSSHLAKKIGIYQSSIDQAEKSLQYRKQGELLTANLYLIKPEMKEVAVSDYTDPACAQVVIPLDPRLNGAQNAQRYFKLYNKAKSTISNTKPFLQNANEEMIYLHSLLLSIDQAPMPEELKEIYNELLEQNFITGKHLSRHKTSGKQSKKKEKEQPSQPHTYYSATGQPIIVGRNNKQNDRMTWKQASPQDLWLHVKEIPGSHVIIPLESGQEFPDDQTLLDGAALAVYFSQARGSSLVPVDYTHVRQIKKPNGAKPGMVVYEQNWSLYLTPDPADIERLLASEAAPPDASRG